MSLLLSWSLAALAGEVVVDVKVPALVALDGEGVAEVYKEARLELTVPDGRHDLVITTEGTPRSHAVVVGERPVVVLIGKSGTTITAGDAPSAVVSGMADVRFRTVGSARLLVQVDEHRVVLSGSRGVVLPLTLGDHPLVVRSGDGTSIFSRGMLTVSAGAKEGTELVVQVAEGMNPETAGDGVAFSVQGR